MLAILAITLAVYATTLNDWFLADDFWFMRSAEHEPFGDYAITSLDFREINALPDFNRYRPLYPIAWYAQHEAFGLTAWPYHAVVVGMHLASVWLVWLIARRLLKETWTANLAALVFGLHPVYAEAVSWLSGGNRVFATLPYLASLLFFMKYHERDGPRSIYYWFASLLLFVVAILMHSSALTLSILLPLYVFLIVYQPCDAFKPRHWYPLLPFVACATGLFAIQLSIQDQVPGFEFGWHMYRSYGRFLGLLAFPASMVAEARPGLLHNYTHYLEGLEGLASVILLLTSIVVATRWRSPSTGLFVAGWLYLAVFPDSTFLAGAKERTLHLAGAPFSLLVALVAVRLKGLIAARYQPLSRLSPIVVILVLIPVSIWTAGIARGPGRASDQDREFVSQLRNEVPSMQSGATLYVVDPPRNLLLFSYIDSLIAVYYEGVTVRVLPPEDFDAVASKLGDDDEIFQFRR